MNSAEVFSYNDYSLADDRRTISFNYSIDHAGETFSLTEQLRFPNNIKDDFETNQALRGLHLALGISYYKLFVTPEIRHPYHMDAAEAEFWNKIWQNGLGEFLYVNKLEQKALASFEAQEGTTLEGNKHTDWKDAALLGIGGGKDSIVAGELLKAAGIPTEGFVLATGEQLGQARGVAATMNIPLHPIERHIDPLLLTLNKRPDAYNGHVPISVVFAFVGSIAALSASYKYVIVANEASASIPRIQTDTVSVNHQWSKSFEFEKMFQDYLHDHVSDNLTYFSAVRSLNSVGVAKLFSQYPQYNQVFTSDNSVFKINPSDRPTTRWSLESPKSLSSFILLAPWLQEEELIKTFERNFLNEDSLVQLFRTLVGIEGEPPLDCVGTVDELRASLTLAVTQGKFRDTALVTAAEKAGLFDASSKAAQDYLQVETEDALPLELRQKLLDLIQQGLER